MSLTGAAASGPHVLLLLVSQGGLGLNLTEAQHVVLLEPLLDPALDVQAIGRVSRFGQTRDTHVHRWVLRVPWRGGRWTYAGQCHGSRRSPAHRKGFVNKHTGVLRSRSMSCLFVG
jgi:hypothetical protein